MISFVLFSPFLFVLQKAKLDLFNHFFPPIRSEKLTSDFAVSACAVQNRRYNLMIDWSLDLILKMNILNVSLRLETEAAVGAQCTLHR